MNADFRRGDSFITAYIYGQFQGHIVKSGEENRIYQGNFCHLNEGMPIRIRVTQQPALPAPPPSQEVAMIDIPALPTVGEANQMV